MRYLHYTKNLTGLKEEWIQSCWVHKDVLTLEIKLPQRPHICPSCGQSTSRVKDYYSRELTHAVNDTLRMYKSDDIRMYNFDCITDTIVEVIITCNTYTLLTVHLL